MKIPDGRLSCVTDSSVSAHVIMIRPTDVIVLSGVVLERCVNAIVNISKKIYNSSQNLKQKMIWASLTLIKYIKKWKHYGCAFTYRRIYSVHCISTDILRLKFSNLRFIAADSSLFKRSCIFGGGGWGWK